MPKTHKQNHIPVKQIGLDARQLGLRAFQGGRFDEAITHWSPLAPQDMAVGAALAEAYFRRALKTPTKNAGADLGQAVALAPNEPRYQYHLGMQLHRTGALAEAITHYQATIEQRGPHGAALLLALAHLELDPQVDLAAMVVAPDISAALTPTQALLRGTPPDTSVPNLAARVQRTTSSNASEAEALLRLWQGLGQIATGDAAAAETLADPRSLANPTLIAIRRSYQGVARAQSGDLVDAFGLWQKTYASGGRTAALLDNLAAALQVRLGALLDTGDNADAATLAYETRELPINNAALNELRIQVFDDAAHTAASSGDWAQAAQLWESARALVGTANSLGSPRPLWHNLALAYEAQEQWLPAAEAWRGMLRTAPRRGSSDTTISAAQWAWVRARVIECYKHAGRPDEAVTVFRQMIKVEPDNLELRLQLADALAANDQAQAAANEIQRILKIDPSHAEAQIRHAELLQARGYWLDAENALRTAVQQQPEHENLRRRFSRLLLDHAERSIDMGSGNVAEPLLREGMALDPENAQFPLQLARVCFNLRRDDEAKKLLEQALELAGGDLQVHLDVFLCWVIEENMTEVRALISRIEELAPPTAFYAQLGTLTIVEISSPPPQPFSLFGRPPAKPQPPVDNEWTALGQELIARALAQQPEDIRLYILITSELMKVRADLAQSIIDTAARLAPEDTSVLITRSIVLALNNQKREAKEQLRKIGILARKSGNRALAARVDAMRREIDSPFFHFAMQMGPLDDDELDYL